MKTKSIKFNLFLKGQGIVNFDSKDQKYYHNRQSNVTLVRHDNVTFAKGNYSVKEDGSLSKTVKISSDCLRHNIHIEEHPSHTVNILHNDAVKNRFMANLGTLQRGYLFPNTGEKKSSVYCISDALNISNSISSIETHSKSGEKKKNLSEDDVADNTFFGRESIGATAYKSEGFISPRDIMFIPISDLYDRRAVQDDALKDYKRLLEANLGSSVEDGYYVNKKSATEIPERGILLTEEQVKIIIKDLIIKMMSVSIGKSQTGYATFDKFEYCVLGNGLDLNKNYSSIETEEDLDNFIDSLSFDCPYEKVDENAAVELFKTLSNSSDVEKEDRKAKKESKKSNKKVSDQNQDMA